MSFSPVHRGKSPQNRFHLTGQVCSPESQKGLSLHSRLSPGGWMWGPNRWRVGDPGSHRKLPAALLTGCHLALNTKQDRDTARLRLGTPFPTYSPTARVLLLIQVIRLLLSQPLLKQTSEAGGCLLSGCPARSCHGTLRHRCRRSGCSGQGSRTLH